MRHHFRSLDTWLEGQCRSCCAEHAWSSDSLSYLEAAGKRSIFCCEGSEGAAGDYCEDTAAEEEEEEDCCAGGDDCPPTPADDSSDAAGINATEDPAAHPSGEEEAVVVVDGGGDGVDDAVLFVEEDAPSPSTSVTLEGGPLAEEELACVCTESDGAGAADEKLLEVVASATSASAASKKQQEGDRKPGSRPRPGATASTPSVVAAIDSASSKSTKKPKRVSVFSSNNNNCAAGGASSVVGAATPAAAPVVPGASAAVTGGGASTKLSRSASKVLAASQESASSSSRTATGAGAGATSSSVSASADFKCAKPAKEGARCYYLGKTNGWKLVRAAMDRRGWTMMPTEYHFSTRYGFKWVERRNQIDYIAHIPGQLVCHIPNNDIITTKIGMLCTLRDKFCKQAPGSTGKLHPPWLPHTYDLESPADCIALIQEEERLASGAASSRPRPALAGAVTAATAVPPRSPVTSAKEEEESGVGNNAVPDAPLLQQALAAAAAQEEDDEDENAGKVGSDITGGIWIYKPSCTNRGRGIKVITGLAALKELCYGKPMGGDGSSGETATTTLPYKGIVQKYIRNPLLVTTEGYKFDVRCYLLIARNSSPGTLAFYHPGYCRLALKPYTVATVASLEDNCVHLTNAAIQKKDAIYQEEGNKELQVRFDLYSDHIFICTSSS